MSGSITPSQSSSRPLQVSVPRGFTAAIASSQSSALLTDPAGFVHPLTSAPPYVSPSPSAYQVPAPIASPPSVTPSQLLSTPSHTSVATGEMLASASAQSPPIFVRPPGSVQDAAPRASSP